MPAHRTNNLTAVALQTAKEITTRVGDLVDYIPKYNYDVPIVLSLSDVFYGAVIVIVIVFVFVQMVVLIYRRRWKKHELERQHRQTAQQRLLEEGWRYYKSQGGERLHLYRTCGSIQDTLDRDITMFQVCGHCFRDYRRAAGL